MRVVRQLPLHGCARKTGCVADAAPHPKSMGANLRVLEPVAPPADRCTRGPPRKGHPSGRRPWHDTHRTPQRTRTFHIGLRVFCRACAGAPQIPAKYLQMGFHERCLPQAAGKDMELRSLQASRGNIGARPCIRRWLPRQSFAGMPSYRSGVRSGHEPSSEGTDVGLPRES